MINFLSWSPHSGGHALFRVFALVMSFTIISPLAAQTADSANQLLARQQLRMDTLENSLKEMTGLIETELRALKIQVDQTSASAVAAETGQSGDFKSVKTELAQLSDSINILEQRMKRTIELSSDVEFRVLRLEKRMQTLLSLSDADLSAQLAQQDVTAVGGAPKVSMSRDVATGETVWTIDENTLNAQLGDGEGDSNQKESEPTSLQNSGETLRPTDLSTVNDSTQTNANTNVGEVATIQPPSEAKPVVVKPTVLPDAGAEDQYRFALGLALRNDLATAETAFSEFRELHPDDERAADALFWLGRVQFMQSQYENAAMTFTSFNKLYDGDARLTDTTLWIAESVAQFANDEQACNIYQSLPAFLDQPPDSFTDRLAELSAGSGCVN
ncbi:tetratricopeptide repeat protein [Alphaproteobacteria bacterium]|nr:tetratricopeptide repeat protein [Alphaproteobacteria bacterium]